MTSHTGRSHRLPFALIVVLFTAASSIGARNQPHSSVLVNQLTALMTDRKLDAAAAQDPASPGHFVAALLVPNSQLLIVSAQYPAPAELQALLTEHRYRDVYAALHQPSAQSTRFFLMDAGCDGLGANGDNVDVLYEKGTTQTVFDGKWKQQGLSEAAYSKRAQDAETRYSRLLSILTTTLQTPTTAARTP